MIDSDSHKAHQDREQDTRSIHKGSLGTPESQAALGRGGNPEFFGAFGGVFRVFLRHPFVKVPWGSSRPGRLLSGSWRPYRWLSGGRGLRDRMEHAGDWATGGSLQARTESPNRLTEPTGVHPLQLPEYLLAFVGREVFQQSQRRRGDDDRLAELLRRQEIRKSLGTIRLGFHERAEAIENFRAFLHVHGEIAQERSRADARVTDRVPPRRLEIRDGF